MGTNPQAEGQTKVSFQISEEDKERLRKLANASGMKLSEYLRRVIVSALSDEIRFETVRSTKNMRVADAAHPFSTKESG